MAPSEGDHVNIFGKYASTPEGKRDLEESDEDEGMKDQREIEGDTSKNEDDVSNSSAPHTNNASPATETTSSKTPVTKPSPKKDGEGKKEWGSDSDDDDWETKFNKSNVTTPPRATGKPNTTSNEATESEAWDGIVARKKSSSPKRKSSLATASLAAATTPQTNNSNNITSPPKVKQQHVNPSPSKTTDTANQQSTTASGTRTYEFNVKFELSTVRDVAIRPAQEVRELLQVLQSIDPSVVIASINTPDIVAETGTDIPNTPQGLERFFQSATVQMEGGTRYILAFTVHSDLSLQQLKDSREKALRAHLDDRKAWLNVHNFPTLITEKIGWFSMKPTGISLSSFRASLTEAMHASYGNNSDSDDSMPPIDVLLSNVSERKNDHSRSISVLSVICQERHAQMFRVLLSKTELPLCKFGAFVSFTTKKNKPTLHVDMVRQHKMFMQNIWTFTVIGLDDALLASDVVTDSDYQETLIEEMIGGQHGILGVDQAKHQEANSPVRYSVAVIRTERDRALRYLQHHLSIIAATSESYQGQDLTVLERRSSSIQDHEDTLSAQFGNAAGSPLRPQRQSTTPPINWLSVEIFPLLPQPESGTVATSIHRSYRQAATLSPLAQTKADASLRPLALNKATTNSNTRDYQTTRGKKPSKALAERVKKMVNMGHKIIKKKSIPPPSIAESEEENEVMETSVELENADMSTIGQLSVGDTLDNSLAASVTSSLTEITRMFHDTASVLAENRREVEELRLELRAMRTEKQEHDKKLIEMESSSAVQAKRLQALTETNAQNSTQLKEAMVQLSVKQSDHENKFGQVTMEVTKVKQDMSDQHSSSLAAIMAMLDQRLPPQPMQQHFNGAAATGQVQTMRPIDETQHRTPMSMIDSKNAETDISTLTSTALGKRGNSTKEDDTINMSPPPEGPTKRQDSKPTPTAIDLVSRADEQLDPQPLQPPAEEPRRHSTIHTSPDTTLSNPKLYDSVDGDKYDSEAAAQWQLGNQIYPTGGPDLQPTYDIDEDASGFGDPEEEEEQRYQATALNNMTRSEVIDLTSPQSHVTPPSARKAPRNSFMYTRETDRVPSTPTISVDMSATHEALVSRQYDISPELKDVAQKLFAAPSPNDRPDTGSLQSDQSKETMGTSSLTMETNPDSTLSTSQEALDAESSNPTPRRHE